MNNTPTNPAFVSRKEELRFYLVELDGEQRVKRLTIEEQHYKCKQVATAWRNAIAVHFNADDIIDRLALKKLNALYACMVEHGE